MIFALEDTAKREIFEETGIRTGMQYLHWFFLFILFVTHTYL